MDDPIDEFGMWYLAPEQGRAYFRLMLGGKQMGLCSRLALLDEPRADFERSLPIIEGCS